MGAGRVSAGAGGGAKYFSEAEIHTEEGKVM